MPAGNRDLHRQGLRVRLRSVSTRGSTSPGAAGTAGGPSTQGTAVPATPAGCSASSGHIIRRSWQAAAASCALLNAWGEGWSECEGNTMCA